MLEIAKQQVCRSVSRTLYTFLKYRDHYTSNIIVAVLDTAVMQNIYFMIYVLQQAFTNSCTSIIHLQLIHTSISISYVTAVRYVAAINHEARGRAAPELEGE